MAYYIFFEIARQKTFYYPAGELFDLFFNFFDLCGPPSLGRLSSNRLIPPSNTPPK
jgi:hypothetical protein